VFFRISSWALGFFLFAVIFGVTIGGLLLGRRLRHRSETLREPFAILQTSLLGVVGLLLAFGLALAVGRYEARRAAVVEEANAIGTTYLRAQPLPESMRTRSLDLLARYVDRASPSRMTFRPALRPRSRENVTVSAGRRLRPDAFIQRTEALST
jgi:hypothetical protein